MDVSSQDLQFLDLSGVEDDECKLLLSLIDCINPAVEVLAPEPPADLRKQWNSPDFVETTTFSNTRDGEEIVDQEQEEQEDSEELEVPVEGQDANQSIFYPDEEEYGGDQPSKSEIETSEVPAPVNCTNNATPEIEANIMVTPEVLPPPAATPDLQYPQAQSNGPMPHPHDVGRPVYSPRSHMAQHPPSNMYSIPPPGHGVPPPNMYPPQGPPPSPAVPTVYVAQCHVNVGGFGNGQPQGGAIMPNHHQPPNHPQSFPPYIHMPEPSQHIPMKNMHEKPEYEPHHRQYQGNGYRVYHRDRGRSRGRGKGQGRRREEHERSNSVSSDHSSYSDSGKHYKDNSMNVPSHYPGQLPPGQIPYSVQYSLGMQGQYMVHQNNLTARSAQGPPLMYTQHPNQAPQFMSGHYHNQAQSTMLAYPHHPHPSQMQHIPDPQHPPVMHQSIPYSQASAMIPPHNIPPHQPGVYMGQPASENIVVSMSHDTMINSNEGVDHLVAMEEQVDVSVSESMMINPQVMQACETAPSVVQPTVYTVDATVCDNSHCVTNQATQLDSPASVQSPSVEVTAPITPCSSSVIVSQSSQVSITEDQNTNATTQLQDNHADSIDNSTKPVSVSNSSTSIMASTDNDVVQPRITPPTGEMKKKSTVTSPPGIAPIVKAVKETSSSSNNNKNTLVVDMSTKLHITAHSSQDIGGISFMEDSSSISLDDDTEVNLCEDDSKDTQVKIICTPQFHPKTSATSPVMQEPVKVVDKDRATPELDPSKNKSMEEVPEVAISPPGGAWAQKKSWAKLFKPNDDLSGKRVAFVAPFVNDITKSEDLSTALIDHNCESGLPDQPLADGDIDKAKIGGMLKSFSQNYHAVPLQPRGLINKGYWCYVNAPLQALLACPPFYNLCTSIPNVAGLKKGKSTTPVIDSMVEFVSEFSPVTNMLKVNRKEKSSAQALRKDPDIMPGQAFEPSYVYKMLSEFSGEQFKEGRQQDAEEMLSCVLNGLHDEMVSALKLAGVKTPSNEAVNGTMNGDGLAHMSDQDEEITESDPDEWQVIGPRKRSCVTRTAHFSPSPISEIFWGQLRFVQQKGGGGNTTANLQPFTTLPLDIQATKVEGVRDALEQLVNREDISYTCSKTKEELTVSKQVLLEHLPQVLILQLKRFIYNKDGGLQKYTKRVSFTIDLEITKELMSPVSRSKFTNNQRKYKLLAVIYHDGKEATKGHYVADIYHSGYNCWLHYDDSVVKPVSESLVLKHAPPRVPYLLFYRRVDTMSGPSSKQKT